MRFHYKENHGILRYFYENQRNLYHEIVTFQSSGEQSATKTEYAFDFNESSYWVAPHGSAQGTVWVSFCLNLYYVKLTHYEITTTHLGNRPTSWNFSVSKDGKEYEHIVTETHNMGLNETYPVRYQPPDNYRCFKFLSIGLTPQNEYCVDIRQFEIFGTVINLPECTLYGYHSFRFRYSLFHFILFLSN